MFKVKVIIMQELEQEATMLYCTKKTKTYIKYIHFSSIHALSLSVSISHQKHTYHATHIVHVSVK